MGTYNEESKDIDNPEWKVIAISDKKLTVEYQEKYGNLKTVECIGLWENDTSYMLSFRDNTRIVLEKSNNVSIRFSK